MWILFEKQKTRKEICINLFFIPKIQNNIDLKKYYYFATFTRGLSMKNYGTILFETFIK